MVNLTTSVGVGLERAQGGSGVPQVNGNEHERYSGGMTLDTGHSDGHMSMMVSPSTSTSATSSQQFPHPAPPTLPHQHNIPTSSATSSSSISHGHSQQSHSTVRHAQQAQLPSPEAMQPTSRFLACLRCRGKKAKCDNLDTVCRACAKAHAECVRPSGRRRKRTRREMEEAERERERERMEGLDLTDSRGGSKRVRDAGSTTNSPITVRSDQQIPQQTPYPQSIYYVPNPRFTANPTSSFNNLSLQSRYAPETQQFGQSYPSQNESYSRSTALHYETLPPPAQRSSPTSISQLLNQPVFGALPGVANAQIGNNEGTSPTKHDPGEVVQSLSKQVAFLEGDPGESQTLKVHYYRFSGCTAIHPGLNRIVIKLKSSVPFKRKTVVSSSPASTVSGISPRTSITGSGSVSTASPLGSAHVTSSVIQAADGKEIVVSPQYSNSEANGLGVGVGPLNHSSTATPDDSMDSDAQQDADTETDEIVDVLLDASSPALRALIEAFFVNFGQHFPFIRKERVIERLRGDTMSRFLLSAMCAVGVRLAPQGYTYPKPSAYISAAWGLALPLLRLPSVDVAAGLLILSWAEFGENSESGLWNFSGMAMRMALDLGLHKIDDTDEAAESFIGLGTHTPSETVTDDVCSGKLLFWAVFVMDRILAFGTGRAPTIQEAIVEVRLPTEEDMSERTNFAARGGSPAEGNEEKMRTSSGTGINGNAMNGMQQERTLHPFVYIVRLFVLAGRIAAVMNGNSLSTRTLSSSTFSPLVSNELRVENQHLALQTLHGQLVDFMSNLPPALGWSVDNFKMQAARRRGGSFLFLHLWANAVLALIHHPNLGRNRDLGLASVVPGAANGDSMANLASTSTNSLASFPRPPPLSYTSSPQSDSTVTSSHNYDETSGVPGASGCPAHSYGSPSQSTFKRSIKLSLASSRHIADCLVFADLFDASSYCANPFINQCLFIAGVAFVFDAQMDSEEAGGVGGGSTRNEFINALVKQNLSALLRALKRMEEFWSGLGYIISVLEQRAAGRGWAKVDFSITSDKKHRFISMPDTGLMRRLKERPSTKVEENDEDHAGVFERDRQSMEEMGAREFTAGHGEEGNAVEEQVHAHSMNGSSFAPQGKVERGSDMSEPMASVVSGGALQSLQNAGPQESSSMTFGSMEGPITMSNWSFESLLGSYQVEEVSATDANVAGFDFGSIFPEGFSW